MPETTPDSIYHPAPADDIKNLDDESTLANVFKAAAESTQAAISVHAASSKAYTDQESGKVRLIAEAFGSMDGEVSPAYSDRVAGFATADGKYLPVGWEVGGKFDEFTTERILEDLHDTRLVTTDTEWQSAIVSDTTPPKLIFGIRWDGTVVIPGLDAGGATATAGVYSDVPWVPHSSVMPVETDMSSWWVLGSSTSEALGPYLTTYATSQGATVLTDGKGGETSRQIMARMGVRPDRITVSGGVVPAGVGGTVSVSSAEGLMNTWMAWYFGWFEGTDVYGQLRYSGGQALFYRQDTGPATPIPAGTRFISERGNERRAFLALFLGGGKNSLNGQHGQDVQVLADWKAQHEWLAPAQKRFLRMGLFCDTNTPAVSSERDQIMRVNAEGKKQWGPLFIDVHDWLTGSDVWTQTGITPTATDLSQQAIGNLPPSLSDGSVFHMGPPAYEAYRDHVLIPRLQSLGWTS